jgi:hypothetical protein
MANIGSGLDAQFGLVLEGTVGTRTTVTRFYEINDASLALSPTFLQSSGIRAGKRFRRAAQVGISRRTALGDINLPVTMLNMGYLWKLLIGSTATAVVASGTAYKQVHIPGTTFTGISATMQLGKPEPATGTICPFTYNGCKVTAWELSVKDGTEANLKLTIDAWDEDQSTTLAVASYVANNDVWNFADASNFKMGGTATTATGECTIAGGSAVLSTVTSFTLTGTNHFATDRYGLGNAGTKREQLESDFCEVTGQFEGEFNKTQFTTPFLAGTTVPIQLEFIGPAIGATGFNTTLSIIVPAAKFMQMPVAIPGADILTVKGDFTAFDDEVNAPLQVKLINTDTVV